MLAAWLAAVGIELDSALVERAGEAAERCGVADRATFLAADFTAPDFDPAPLCPGHPAKVPWQCLQCASVPITSDRNVLSWELRGSTNAATATNTVIMKHQQLFA